MQSDITAEEVAVLTGGIPELMQLIRHLTLDARSNPESLGPLSMSPSEALAAVSAIDGEEPSEEDTVMFSVFERLGWNGEQIECFLDARKRVGMQI